MPDIRVIDGSRPDQHTQPLLEQAYRLRHHVFAERLGWVPVSPDGREQDEYDALPCLHVLQVDAAERVQGCFRMMTTSGPCLLKDKFAHLAGRSSLPMRVDAWDISRFAVVQERPQETGLPTVSTVTIALLLAMYRIGRTLGIGDYTCVTDVHLERLLGRAGLRTQRFAPPRNMGNCQAVAGIAPVTGPVLARIEARAALLLPGQTVTISGLETIDRTAFGLGQELPHAA